MSLWAIAKSVSSNSRVVPKGDHVLQIWPAGARENVCPLSTPLGSKLSGYWTVGMSRSIFALKFKETVGVSPMQYLTRWRMLLAGDKIANTSGSISEFAESLGYESASAFTKAFKKIMACSPRKYNRGHDSRFPAYSEGKAARANRPQPLQR